METTSRSASVAVEETDALLQSLPAVLSTGPAPLSATQAVLERVPAEVCIAFKVMVGALAFTDSGPGRVQLTGAPSRGKPLLGEQVQPLPDGVEVSATPAGKVSVTVMVCPAAMANGPRFCTTSE